MISQGRAIRPISIQNITLSTGSVSQLTVPAGVKGVLIVFEAQNVRWTPDGTDPSSTVGLMALAGSAIAFDINSSDAAKLKFIGLASGAAISIGYFQ